MDGGVPGLPENYIERGSQARGSFVNGVVEKLLAGMSLALVMFV